ncbi:MAG TPA: RHS repeat-associated core domain-containing protein [Anaerolineales bacterium]|nr:RHS repeat-associated core domain-containing protein [Anaerolineales bacterium]HRK91369.1 RHS repeat-associated core domain-containing protein [Anaerolineales bacterium]
MNDGSGLRYSYPADFGLMFYNARWYDPGINQFATPDTIIPDPSDPQDFDRYTYVRNNPIRYTDPSGHFSCSSDKNSDEYCPGKPNGSITSPPKQPKPKPPRGEEQNSQNQNRSHTYTYDTMELAERILPFSSSQWGAASLFFDEVALTLDAIAGIIVLGHVALGTAGTLTFEGNPTGASGGYIMGEWNPATRGLVFAGNVFATVATQIGVIQAIKDGSHRNVTTLTVSENNISISSQFRISGNVMLAEGLTALGWAAQPVSLSLPAQSLAVQNDRGKIPVPSITFTGSIKIPIP